MNDVPENEAVLLLSQPLVCEDCRDWEPIKEIIGRHETSCGLLNNQGINVRLFLDMSYRRSPKTNTVRCVFSVFKRLPRGLERVYQLDISQWNKPVNDKHSQSHEHVGTKRIPGDSAWQRWTFDDIMMYFCRRTNITFAPPLAHPEVLQLKEQK